MERTEGPVSSLEVNIVNRFTILYSGDGPILKGDPDYPYDSGGVIEVSFPASRLIRVHGGTNG